MRECHKYVTSDLKSMDMIKARINEYRDQAVLLYPASFFNRRIKELHGHRMAVDHALEIISSIEGRFITGTSDPEPRMFRGKGHVYPSYDNLFDEDK